MSKVRKVPAGPSDNWTVEDQIKARHEGWMFLFKRIVWAGMAKGRPACEIRIKTANVKRYIQRRAEAGSKFHQRALAEEVRCRLTSTRELHELSYD